MTRNSTKLSDQAGRRSSFAGLAKLPPAGRRVVDVLAQRLNLGTGPSQVLNFGLVGQVLKGDHALEGLTAQIDTLSFKF